MANVRGVSTIEIEQKQNELERLIKDYYSYDLETLKVEINRILQSKTLEIDSQKDSKIGEIIRQFKEISTLATNHIQKGSQFATKQTDRRKVNNNNFSTDDDYVMEQYEERSQEYEGQVRQANREKLALREQICHLENDIRTKRDQLADR